MQSFSSLIDKTFSARDIINAISYSGICTSYKETLHFEASTLKDPDDNKTSVAAYLQYIYDNTDHNTSTLDGKNTFHVMGEGKVVTPESGVTVKKSIAKLLTIPSAEDLAERGFVKFLRSEKPKSEGLKGIKFKEILKKDIGDNFINTPMEDLMWFHSK